MNLKETNYYVLFAQSQYCDLLCEQLNQNDDMQAIHPKMEYYRRDIKGLAIKALFPGYVLVRTKLDQQQFDGTLKKTEGKKGLLKQLKYKDGLSALASEEIMILQKLLDENGLLKMSYGHLENKRLKVDTGPLTGFDDYVIKVDRHNRLLKLDLFFLDHQQWIAPITIQESI